MLVVGGVLVLFLDFYILMAKVLGTSQFENRKAAFKKLNSESIICWDSTGPKNNVLIVTHFTLKGITLVYDSCQNTKVLLLLVLS